MVCSSCVTVVELQHVFFIYFCFKPFLNYAGKWPNILLKFYGVHTTRFLKFVWSFFTIIQGMVDILYLIIVDIVSNDANRECCKMAASCIVLMEQVFKKVRLPGNTFIKTRVISHKNAETH